MMRHHPAMILSCCDASLSWNDTVYVASHHVPLATIVVEIIALNSAIIASKDRITDCRAVVKIVPNKIQS